jgi:predicted MFS family arabinose efflux permease
MSSALAPFRHRAFAVIWTANLVSLFGRWMHDVGAGWLMATLSPSPLWVALVQTSATLPVFLLALPAGAVADLVDRRWLITTIQSLTALTALVFASLVLLERVAPWSLLAFTTVLGVGLAFYGPARNALVPQLVPRRELHAAILLNSLGVNLSRALGPALAGVLIGGIGIAAPFVLNVLTFGVLIAAYLWWRPAPTERRAGDREPLARAILTGLRFARGSRPLRAALLKAVSFFAFASAYWSLLPLVAKTLLGGGSQLYGLLIACVGAGAVAGAFLIPMLKARLGVNGVVDAAPLGSAAAMGLVALVPSVAAGVAASLIFGVAWIGTLSLINTSAQLSLPDWVRARGMALLLSVFFGALGLGSLLWGGWRAGWDSPLP